MVEKIKSLLLVILVGLSLYLTYQLWYGRQPAELVAEDVYERVVVERPRPLEQVIYPAFAVIPVENGYYLAEGGRQELVTLWSLMEDSLSQLTVAGEAGSITDNEEASKLITFYFNPALPVGPDTPWVPLEVNDRLTGVELRDVNGDLVLTASTVDSQLLLRAPVSSATGQSLAEAVSELLQGEYNLYFHLTADMVETVNERQINLPQPLYLPQGSVTLHKPLLKPEEIDRELLLKTFFVDYNLARVIEEKDGGLIYTDGEKGLRLTGSGLEYSNPRIEEGRATVSYLDALNNSNNLLSYHGGWPFELRLESVSTTGWADRLSYAVQWRITYDGYPLHTAIPTRMIFNDRGLIHYSRALFFENGVLTENGESLAAATWQEALAVSVGMFEEEYPGINSPIRLETMHLAYAVLSGPAGFYGEPAWYIRLNGKEFLLKADTLTPIDEEALS